MNEKALLRPDGLFGGLLPQTRFFGPEMRSGPVAICGVLCYHNTYYDAPRVPLKDVYVV